MEQVVQAVQIPIQVQQPQTQAMAVQEELQVLLAAPALSS
jgi:hypothetical protein